MNRSRLGVSICLLFTLLAYSHVSKAQPPYIENGLLTIPVVQVGGENYRVELSINTASNPLQMNLTRAELAENVSSIGVARFEGTVLTIPKLRFEGKNYELTLSLTNADPVTFTLTTVREIAENFAATNLITYSPEACQADIELFGSETFFVQDHPEGFKGDFFGSKQIDVATSSFSQSAFVSLRFNTVLALAQQQPPGIQEGAAFRLPVIEFTVASDLGQENDPDYPVAFTAQVQVDSFTREAAVYRSDGKGGLDLVTVTGDSLQLGDASGVIESITDIRLSADGALFFNLHFEDNDKDYLVKQDRPGSGLVLLLATGDGLNTGDSTTVRSVGKIGPATPNVFNQAIVEIEVLDEFSNVEGFAYIAVDNFTGSYQCLSSDSSIVCFNGAIAQGETLRSFSSDGATLGILISAPGESIIEYKVIANPITERIRSGVEFQGYTFHDLKKPLVCESRNALYFVGSFFESPIGAYDELFRIDENNNLSKITDFKSLLLDPALEGQVPDEVRDWSIGYNCDAALYMWGPSGPDSSQGYQAHWASYLTGETMEILDETPGRPNGNGTLTSVQSSTSGIDATATGKATTGPNGEFYFVPRVASPNGSFVSTYGIATKPANCP